MVEDASEPLRTDVTFPRPRTYLWPKLTLALVIGMVLGYCGSTPVRRVKAIESPSGRYYAVLNYDDAGPRITIISLRIYEKSRDREMKLPLPDRMVFAADTNASARMRYKAHWENDRTLVFESSDIGSTRYTTCDGGNWVAER